MTLALIASVRNGLNAPTVLKRKDQQMDKPGIYLGVGILQEMLEVS